MREEAISPVRAATDLPEWASLHYARIKLINAVNGPACADNIVWDG